MVSFRCLPHGTYGLMVVVIATCGWIASLMEDGCNYSIVSDENIISMLIPGDNGLNDNTTTMEIKRPYVELGLIAYRLPYYDTLKKGWYLNRSGACFGYPSSFKEQMIDSPWRIAKTLGFFGLVLGGGASLFLWTSTCCTFTKMSWRWAGIETVLALCCQVTSFLWFKTRICQFPQEDVNTISCALSDGSKADILSACLWFLTSLLIFCHYPKPNDIIDSSDGIMVNDRRRATPRNNRFDGNGSSSSLTRSVVSTSTIGSTLNNKDDSQRSIQLA